MIQVHLQHNQMLHYLLLNIIYDMEQQELSKYTNIDKVISPDNFSIQKINYIKHIKSFFLITKFCI